jgi:hypothetical protein
VTAAEMEQVVDLIVGCEEALGLTGRFELLHLPSRRRVGWCEFSALLFNPLCCRCSMPGMMFNRQANQILWSRHPLLPINAPQKAGSTGAIIAPLVGLGLSVDEIAKLYCKHVVEIMSRWPPGWKNAALEELASKVFGDPKFDAFKRKMGGWG